MGEKMTETELPLFALYTKSPYGHPDFIPLCLDEIRLHSEKNKDYTSGDASAPLGNFYRVSAFLLDWGIDIPPYLVAFIYMMKQLDAVGNMLGENYKGEIEGIEERLRDVSVYAKLIQILYEEAQDGQKNLSNSGCLPKV